MRTASGSILLLFALAAAILIVPANAATYVRIGTSSTTTTTTTTSSTTTTIALSCSNYCNTGGPYGGSACSSTAEAPYPTTCYVAQKFNTAYQQSSNPLFNNPSTISPYYQSPANSVSSYNVYNAPWFLTCPVNPYSSPNPTDSRLFYTSPYNNNQFPFVAGDVCLANTQDLTTQLRLPVTITWTSSTPAKATVRALETTGAADLQISALAYSPMYQAGLQNVISSTYYNSSYIFQKVPAAAQNAIWTWSATYANFSGAVQDTQTVNANPIIDKAWPISSSADDDSNGALAGSTAHSAENGTLALTQSGGAAAENSSGGPQFRQIGGECSCNSCDGSGSCDYCPASCPAVSVSTNICSSGYFCSSPGTSSTSTSTSTTTTSPTTTIESYTCQYSYKYSETTSLQSVNNQQVPFTEVELRGSGSSQQEALNSFSTSILPYFTYNFSAPSPDSQALSLSYDIFGPWNYYTPANSIDLFPIDTPDSFYINYNGLLISGPVSSLLNGNALQSLLSNIEKVLQNAGNIGGLLNALSHRKLSSPAISAPIAIAAMPNDYIFVLNQSSSNSNYYISVLRLIPHGYYNSSSDQPSGVQNVSVDSSQQAQGAQQYANAWSSYWNNVTALQNQTTYVVDSVDITTLLQGYTYCTQGSGRARGFCYPFTPLNISVDDRGDIYMSGYFASVNKPGLVKITGILNNSLSMTHASSGWTANETQILPLVAATPTSGLVFMGGPNSGYLYEFSGNDLSSLGSLSLSFNATNNTVPGENIALNIPAYLQDGGLYNLSIPGLYSYGTKFNPGTDFDKASYHHVLGLQEVNGYLYVLDDWAAGLNSQSCYTFFTCPNANMNILMVRVLNSTGFNVPLSPTLTNDLYQQQKCTATGSTNLLNTCTNKPPSSSQVQCLPSSYCSIQETGICGGRGSIEAQYDCVASGTKTSTYYATATGLFGNTSTYPPYGWVLSANITVSGWATINFCSSSNNAGSNPACGWNPGHLPQSYKGNFKPIGPALGDVYVTPTDVGFSVNYNNTVNLIIKPGSSGSWHLCTAFGVLPLPCYTTVTSPHYSELIVGTTLNVENYTKLFDGISTGPVYCYTDSSADAAPQGSSNGCQLLSGVSEMNAPVYTVANPFRYLESLGAAQQLTFAGAVSSGLPPGIANSSCASQLINGQPCSGTPYKTNGPPSMQIQQAPVGWGLADQITVQSPSSSNTVEILINGTEVASAQGTATYVICSTPAFCLQPGNYQIQGRDATSGKSVSYTLQVNATPLLTLTPGVQVEGNTEYMTVNTFNNQDKVELLKNGVVVVPPRTGSISYNESNYSSAPGYYVMDAMDITNGKQSAVVLYVVSNATSSASGQPSAATESLTSQIGGYVLVPYEYTYRLQQSWSNPSPTTNGTTHDGVIQVYDSDDYGNGCSTSGVFAQQGTSSTSTISVFSTALTGATSNKLSATIEGGYTYLHDLFNNDYFIPNLTDTGLILPPQIQYEIQNDRLFATVYANSTLCPMSGGVVDCSKNTQLVLNASNQSYYQVLYHIQSGPNTPSQIDGGYKVFSTYPTFDQNSASLVHGTPAAFTSNGAVFNYSSLFIPTSVPLFSLYKQVVYDSTLNLYLNGTSYAGSGLSLLGYQRLTYVFVDRFGNRIYAPIDADIAYPVTVTLKVNSHVSLNNSNLTTVNITGQAGVFSNLNSAFTPLGAGNSIYLYYNKDLNFVNYNPRTDPVNAIYCAYSLNSPLHLNCTQSNPVLVGDGANDNISTYAPMYNASGTCGPPPNGLLERNVRACNIYNSLGLSARCPSTASSAGSEEFCSPIYLNGTGFCTSQLGLITIAKTGVNGTFNYTTTACGNSQDQILGRFYGYPGPEPVPVKQAPLGLSQNSIGSYSGQLTQTNNLNYQYAPSKEAAAVFQVGLFLLSYNNIGIVALLASAATALALLFMKRRGRG